MKRSRGNDEPDRAELERQAMAELQRQSGAPPVRRGTPARSGRPAWGADAAPARGAPQSGRPEAPEAQPARRASPRPERVRPEPDDEPAFRRATEASEDDAEEVWDDEEWVEDGEIDDEGQPLGLLGIPLDYDATGIALQQLAERSNVRRPASFVQGVDGMEAEQARDKAMAQFLERQKIRQRQDAELAAARAAASPEAGSQTKRPAFPPLSPGLSAKSLVMQPVAAPPLNRPQPAAGADPSPAGKAKPSKPAATAKPCPAAAKASGGRSRATQDSPKAPAAPNAKKAAPTKAISKKAITKKAITKKAITKKAITKEVASTRVAPAKSSGKKVAGTRVATKRPASTKSEVVAATQTTEEAPAPPPPPPTAPARKTAKLGSRRAPAVSTRRRGVP